MYKEEDMSDQDLTILHEGRFLRFMNRNGWEYVQRKNISGIVLVVAVTDDDEVLLVEQFRPPVGQNVIELCAGLAGDIPGQEDEDLTVAARRELLEECGYEAETMEFLMEGPPAQGLCDEYITFFKASGLRKVDDGGGDESEDIIVHKVKLKGIDAWFDAQRKLGKMIDPKVYAGLYFVRD